jgi:hypothetical protein
VKRLSFFCAVAAAIALVLPVVGSADPPIREFLPLEDFTIVGQCPFDVNVHVIAIKEYSKTFSDGQQMINGKVFLRITNAETGSRSGSTPPGPAPSPRAKTGRSRS